MNKNILIAIVVVVLLAGGYVYMNQSKNVDTPVQTIEQTETKTEESKLPKTLRELLALSTSQKCTFVNEVQGSKSEGTVYLASGRMRGDFTSRVDARGKTIMSHMITQNNETRVWQDGEVTGFLMKVPEQGNTSATPQGETAPLSYDQNVDYDCTAWSADESVFLPPAHVIFRSVADMMQGGGAGDAHMMEGDEPFDMNTGAASGGVEMKEVQCRNCEQAPDAKSKAQCRLAFQCQ